MRLGIPDSEFIRGEVPMTKQEVRILSVAKLQLDKASVVYDIGAGTGSVSIEVAAQCPDGRVYAIEKASEGISLIDANRKKFNIGNIELVEGTAPQCMERLPAPTHVFIGGSGGRLVDIIKAVRKKNPKVRFVLNAVTLETMGELMKLQSLFPEYADMEVIQVSVSRAKVLGNHHLMRAENPVCIAAFGASM